MTNPEDSVVESGTPETNAFLASSPSAGSNSNGVTLIRSLETRLIAARDEIETWRMKLVACDVAADANTPESAAGCRIARDHDYWSAAYGAVVSAIDREMALRAEVAAETTRANIAEAQADEQARLCIDERKRADELQASLDRLHGMRFSDRTHAALISRAETAEGELAATKQRAEVSNQDYVLVERLHHEAVSRAVNAERRLAEIAGAEIPLSPTRYTMSGSKFNSREHIVESPNGHLVKLADYDALRTYAMRVTADKARRLDLTSYINAAQINGTDVPHIVVEKLQLVIDAEKAKPQ